MIKDTDLPFRQLVEAAPDGMVVCDSHGEIVLVNGEAERMFDDARDELLGHAGRARPHRALPACHRAQDRRARHDDRRRHR
jgi:PAS domain S-box-containing protein